MIKKLVEKFSDFYIIFCIYALIGWLYEVLWMRFVVEPFEFINRGVLFGPFLPIYGFGMLILFVLLGKFISKKHTVQNPIYLSISVFTIITFIYTTIIEFTTPKIYHVDTFLQNYGLGLILVNLLGIIIANIFVQKTKNKKMKNIDATLILTFLLIWIITTLIEYVSHYFIETYSNKLLWDYTYDFLNINKRVNWDASRNFAIGGTFLLYVIQPLVNKFLQNTKFNKKVLITLIIGIPMLIDYIINVVLK